MKSPYLNRPVSAWSKITDRIVARHPLKHDEILQVSLQSWEAIWNTTINTGHSTILLRDIDVPATIVGYFFEILFAKEMEGLYPNTWRGCRHGDEKDLVHIANPDFSVEIKSSGQRGLKVFGNRSYGQKAQDAQRTKKEKSGYYITVNFYKKKLSLIRFGWIDADDWKPQASQTGQMAGLPEDVYRHKLRPIRGKYELEAHVEVVVPGIGPKTSGALAQLGIETVEQFLNYNSALPPRAERIREQARVNYEPLLEA